MYTIALTKTERDVLISILRSEIAMIESRGLTAETRKEILRKLLETKQ